MRKGIVLESIVVGFTTLVIGSALMIIPSKKLKQNKAWPFIGTFLVGFLAHIGYKSLGLDKYHFVKIR